MITTVSWVAYELALQYALRTYARMPKDYAAVTGLPSLPMYFKLLEIAGIIVGTKLDVEEELDFAASDDEAYAGGSEPFLRADDGT